jgi:hypothetical protein
MMVAVSVKKREDTGDLTNEVKGYKTVAAVMATRQAEPTAATGKPAWM